MISASGLHKGKAFSKALLKIAQAKYFDLPDLRNTTEDEIIFQIERRMASAGLRPGQGAAERFFEATGLDTSQWSQELEKLALYAGDSGQELTRDDVNMVISGSREVLIWDFCAAVLGGDAKLALAQLSALLAQDESEVGILILLAGQVRLAALAAVLSDNRMLSIKGGRVRLGDRLAGGDSLPATQEKRRADQHLFAGTGGPTRSAEARAVLVRGTGGDLPHAAGDAYRRK